MGITANSVFTLSANVPIAANKARGMLYFIKRSPPIKMKQSSANSEKYY